MFYALEPEVPAQLGQASVIDYSVTPYQVVRLHPEMDGWMGDDLCAVGGNNYFVTDRLHRTLAEAQLTGCEWSDIEVARSDLFLELYPDRELPRFWWLKPIGQSRVDDFAIGPGRDGVRTLLVSERALRLMRKHVLQQCTITPVF